MFRGRRLLKVGMLLAIGLFMAVNVSFAVTLDFSNVNGYGLDNNTVMIENMRLDTEIVNPFDPSRPEIVSSFFNIPFYFDYATLHLVPDLSNAAGGGAEASCASLEVEVTDAYTGYTVANALVSVGSDFAYTDANGIAQFSGLFAGSAQISSSISEYMPSERNVTLACGGESTSVGIAMNPTTGEGAIAANGARIVLSWGENPRDLDSHLTGPTSASTSSTDETNRFHVYFGNRNADVVAELDVDDTSSYGPETVTLSPEYAGGTLRAGLYRYSVHHYSGDDDISSSNASVSLTIGNSTRNYTPPAGSPGDNAVWTVFEINVSADGSATIYDVNTFTADQSASAVRSTRTGYGSVETGIDFSQLPSK